MNEEAIAKLNEIFQIVFELAADTDVTLVRQMNTQKWDSMATVSLVAAIESEFGISIDVSDAFRLTSYQATLLFLEEKLQ